MEEAKIRDEAVGDLPARQGTPDEVGGTVLFSSDRTDDIDFAGKPPEFNGIDRDLSPQSTDLNRLIAAGSLVAIDV